MLDIQFLALNILISMFVTLEKDQNMQTSGRVSVVEVADELVQCALLLDLVSFAHFIGRLRHMCLERAP